ncbi:hypothetical protein ABIB40_003674 [Pedobacter sp. UYP30]
MKNLMIYCCLPLLICIQACAQKQNKKEQKLTTMEDKLPQYPKDKQISYIVHLNSKTPFELYLDDNLVDWEWRSGFNKSVELNPFLLNNGTHILKIRFSPPESNEDKLIHPTDIIADKNVKWNLYFVKLKKDDAGPLGYEGKIDYPSSELPIIAPPANVPVWEQEFKVEVAGLPYKLKGWSDGEDLSKLDQKVLEKEAFTYFNNLRNLLNDGKVKEFMALNKTNDFETSVSNYDNQEQYDEDYRENVELLTKKCKGNMQSIDNYVMKLYGHGKILRLEIPQGKYKHWSALMSDSKKYGKSSWGIMVYRHKGSKDFVIIRK